LLLSLIHGFAPSVTLLKLVGLVRPLEDGTKRAVAAKPKIHGTAFTATCDDVNGSRCSCEAHWFIVASATDAHLTTLEISMRATLALLLAVTASVSGMATLPGDAEAAGQYYRYRGKTYRITKSCDHDCVRANHLDPGGNYKAYPNWARAALSPKTDGGGNRR
jgi:uncharacterized membrane protein